jgi:hypothetical protein
MLLHCDDGLVPCDVGLVPCDVGLVPCDEVVNWSVVLCGGVVGLELEVDCFLHIVAQHLIWAQRLLCTGPVCWEHLWHNGMQRKPAYRPKLVRNQATWNFSKPWL